MILESTSHGLELRPAATIEIHSHAQAVRFLEFIATAIEPERKRYLEQKAKGAPYEIPMVEVSSIIESVDDVISQLKEQVI